MGVADMASTSIAARICLRRSLWRTPKRCSSSTTSRPRSWNLRLLREDGVGADEDVDLACFGGFSTMAVFSFAVRKRESISTLTGKLAKRRLEGFVVLEARGRWWG